ncbi:hypothetical protein I5535_11415 [Rhodobacteraceae bacterium F11138]|nr:hypothetical protein [Rhodobacteraceae bacterium F11138]
MARRKTPLAKAELTGQIRNHPGRYADRREPETAGPIGDPPKWLTAQERAAWRAFAQELPWLTASDTALVSGAAALRARIEARDGITASDFRELRMFLTAMGGTPTSRSSVAIPEPVEQHDPWEQFV